MDEHEAQAVVVQELSNASDAGNGRRSRRNNIPAEIRKKRAIERAAKNEAAWAELQVAMQNYKDDIRRIAMEHGVSFNGLKRKALHAPSLRSSRGTNGYNAFRRFRKVDLQTVKFGINDQQREALVELQGLPHGQGYQLFQAAPDDIKDVIRMIHDQYRMSRMASSRGSRKSIGQAFRRSTERIASELETLSTRCRTTAICIVVRSNTNGTHDPFIYTDSVSKEFFESIKNLNINVLAEQYEGYAIQGISALAGVANSNRKRLTKKTEVRERVREGLREITGKDKLNMSWNNYRTSIVERHFVKLVGWPSSLSFDIDSMSSRDLQQILEGLKNKTITWVHDTEGRNKENELISSSSGCKRRRQRSDKGEKRGIYKKRKALAPITNAPARETSLCLSDTDSSSNSDDSTSGDSDDSDI